MAHETGPRPGAQAPEPHVPAAEPGAAQPAVAPAGPEARAHAIAEPRRRFSRRPLIVSGLAAVVAFAGGVIFRDNIGQAKDNVAAAVSGQGKQGTPTTGSAASDAEAKAAMEKRIADLEKAIKERDQADAAKAAQNQTDQKAKTDAAKTESRGPVKTENLGTLADVAKKYGGDSKSRNVNSWEWAPGEEGFAAHLKPTDDFAVTHLNLSDTSVIEGYFDVLERRENTSFDAVTLLAGPTQKTVPVRGATVRESKDPTGLVIELRGKLVPKEAKEQPGTIILEACPPADLVGNSGVRNLGTLADFAKKVGRDSYTKNLDKWEWVKGEEGFAAHLIVPTDGLSSRIELSGNLVAEGYFDAPERAENTRFNAISFVAHPSQGLLDGRGFTVRDFENADGGFAKLAREHIANEAKDQPGTITLLLKKCPTLPPAK